MEFTIAPCMSGAVGNDRLTGKSCRGFVGRTGPDFLLRQILALSVAPRHNESGFQQFLNPHEKVKGRVPKYDPPRIVLPSCQGSVGFTAATQMTGRYGLPLGMFLATFLSTFRHGVLLSATEQKNGRTPRRVGVRPSGATLHPLGLPSRRFRRISLDHLGDSLSRGIFHITFSFSVNLVIPNPP